MTIPEILNELELYTGQFPKEAMQAAVEQREAITPELLRVIEAVAENPVEWAKRKDYMAHVFALFLLAQFREARALPAIVKMFSAPGETPFDLTGDVPTEGLSQILGSVYDGNPALLMGLIENKQANEYVRSAAIDAFLVLEHTGQMSRDQVIEYFRSLFHGKLEKSHSYVWDGLVGAVADLPAPELLEEVRQADTEGLMNYSVADLEWIEKEIASPYPWRRDRHRLITEAIGEMEGWAAFQPEPAESMDAPLPYFPLSERPELELADYEVAQPYVRGPKIGRNDPCPCGSGKKYKKCCGNG